MDIMRAKEIVSALADGVDPITGELLPRDHVCNQAEVIRAFYTLLDMTKPENGKTPKNSGKPWPAEEDEELKTLYETGMGITKLGQHFGRTKGAIEARLEKLGLKESH